VKWLNCKRNGNDDIICKAIVEKRLFKYYFGGSSNIKVGKLDLGSPSGKKSFNIC